MPMVYCNGVHIPILFLLIAVYNFLTCIRFNIGLFCISLSLNNFLSGFEIIFTTLLGLWRSLSLHLSEQNFMLGCDLPSESTFTKFFEHITQFVLMLNHVCYVDIYLTIKLDHPAKSQWFYFKSLVISNDMNETCLSLLSLELSSSEPTLMSVIS